MKSGSYYVIIDSYYAKEAILTGKADDLIKKVVSDGKLTEMTYRDEPILFPASKMKNFTPKKYAEMRKIGSGRPFIADSAKDFLLQARFMADFEDDYDFGGEFSAYYPTYADMTAHQLRGYFSWRTKIRHGIFEKAPLSFAFVYMYELINGVGTDSPRDAFDKLYDFAAAYAEADGRVTPYASGWLGDLVVYNGLDCALLERDLVFNGDGCDDLCACGDDELIEHIYSEARYYCEHAVSYKKHPEEARAAMLSVCRELDGCRPYNEYDSALAFLSGKRKIDNYHMFAGAVFCPESLHEDCVYQAGAARYICRNGFWSYERLVRPPEASKLIAAVIKEVDRLLRKAFGEKPIKGAPLPRDIGELVESGVEKYLRRREEERRPRIDIDVSKLGGIRAAAEVTCGKLMTEADMQPDEPEPAEKKPTASAPETELLRLLLAGESYAEFLRESGGMLSVLIDAINEKYFDEFGDTVIDFDGETPYVIEDYAEDLKGLIENENT